jgi:hypothetical protein
LQPPVADFDTINLNDGLNLKDGLVEAQRHFVVQMFYVEQSGREAGSQADCSTWNNLRNAGRIWGKIPPMAAK